MPTTLFEQYILDNLYQSPPSTASYQFSTQNKSGATVDLERLSTGEIWRSLAPQKHALKKKKIIVCCGDKSSFAATFSKLFKQPLPLLETLQFELYAFNSDGKLIPTAASVTFFQSRNAQAVRNYLADNHRDQEGAFHILTHYEMSRLLYAYQESSPDRQTGKPFIYTRQLDTSYDPQIEDLVQDPDIRCMEALEINTKGLNNRKFVASYEFFQGIQKITIHGSDIPEVTVFKTFLAHLPLAEVHISYLPQEGGAFLSKLPAETRGRIKEVMLYNDTTASRILSSLHLRIPHIQTLEYAFCPIPSRTLDFSQCQHLTSLKIEDPEIKHIVLPPHVEYVELRCENLISLRSKTSLLSLKTLNLPGCEKLRVFPQFADNSAGRVEPLEKLDLTGCGEFKCIPGFQGAREVHLSGYTMLKDNDDEMASFLLLLKSTETLFISDETNAKLLGYLYTLLPDIDQYEDLLCALQYICITQNDPMERYALDKTNPVSIKATQDAIGEIWAKAASAAPPPLPPPPPAPPRHSSTLRMESSPENNGPAKFYIHTKIFDENENLVCPSTHRREIYDTFDESAALVDRGLKKSEVYLTFSSAPLPYSKHHRAITQLNCERGEAIPLSMRTGYDTLTWISAPTKFRVQYDEETARYFVIPQKSGLCTLKYLFIHRDPQKLAQATPMKKGLDAFIDSFLKEKDSEKQVLQKLPKAFMEGIDTLIVQKDDFEIPGACFNFLSALEKFKKIKKPSQQEIAQFDAVIFDYFNSFLPTETVPDVFDFFENTPPAIAEQLGRLIQQIGVCRHRALLALACYQYVGLPAYVIANACHAFIARYQLVSEGKKQAYQWREIDLGGGEGELIDALAHPMPEEEKQEAEEEELAEPELTQTPELFEEEKEAEESQPLISEPVDPEYASYLALFAPVSLKVIAENPDTDSLLKWSRAQKRVLIQTDNFAHSRALYQALSRSLASKKEQDVEHVLYIESAQDILRFMQLAVVEEDGELTAHSLLTHPKGHLIINWGRFSSTEIATYKSIFDNPPTILVPNFKNGMDQPPVMEVKPFPRSIKTTNLMHREVLCESFTSRFSGSQRITWPRNYTLPSCAEEEKQSTAATEEKDAYSVYWESLLMGKIGSSNDRLSFIAGELENTIKAKKGGFTLLAPPAHSPEFEVFWLCLTTQRRFLSNGRWVHVPEGFSLHLAPAPQVALDKIRLVSASHIETKEEDDFCIPVVEEIPADLDPALKIRAEKIKTFFSYLSTVPHGLRGTPESPRMSDARFQKALDALEKNTGCNNPIKALFSYDYDKNSENYAFLNVIAKMLFAENAPEEKEAVRWYKLRKLETRFANEDPKTWQWRRANCCSGRELRRLFDIQSDADIAQLLSEIQPMVLPEMAEKYAEMLDTELEANMPEVIPEKKSAPFKKSMDRMQDALDTYGMVVLKGPPGSGKSYAAAEYANQAGRQCYWGKNAIAAWRAHQAPGITPVLVIDEVSLEALGSLNAIYPLPPGHQAIFTDNPASDSVTRQLDPLIQDQVTVYVNAWSKQERLEKLLLPLARKLDWPRNIPISPRDQNHTGQAHEDAGFASTSEITKPGGFLRGDSFSPPLNSTGYTARPPNTPRDFLRDNALTKSSTFKYERYIDQEALCNALLEALDIAKNYGEENRFSTRDLHQIMLRLVHRMQTQPNASWESLLLPVMFDEWSALIKNISDFKAAMRAHFSPLEEVPIDSTEEKTQHIIRGLKAKGHYIPQSREAEIALLLEDILLQQNKSALAAKGIHPPSTGKSGLLLEGASGIGKSTVLREIFFALNIDFIQFTVGERSLTEAALLEAFHQGQKVILDELNLDVGLESLLNQLMTGKTKDGKSAEKPGFLVVATQNSAAHKGRDELSAAIYNRVHFIKPPKPTQAELEEMAAQAGLSSDLAEKCVRAYLTRHRQYPEEVNTRSFFQILALQTKKEELVDASVWEPEPATEPEDVPPATASAFPHIPENFSSPALPAHWEKTTSPYVYASGNALHLFEQTRFEPIGDGTHRITTAAGQLDASIQNMCIVLHQAKEGVLRRIHDHVSEPVMVMVNPAEQTTEEALAPPLCPIEKLQIPQHGAMWIASHDPNTVSTLLQKQLPGCIYASISTSDQWNTFFEDISLIQKNPLRFRDTLHPILQALLRGENVILNGHLPEDIALSLMSLFDPEDPYLTLQGERIRIPGRLLLVTHPIETYAPPFYFAPARTCTIDPASLYARYEATALHARYPGSFLGGGKARCVPHMHAHTEERLVFSGVVA